MTAALASAEVVLAVAGVLPGAADPEVTPDTGGSAGFLGFVFTFALALALVVLVVSLRRQLRAVDRNARAAGLPTPPRTAPTPPAAASELSGVPTPTPSDAAEGAEVEGEGAQGENGQGDDEPTGSA